MLPSGSSRRFDGHSEASRGGRVFAGLLLSDVIAHDVQVGSSLTPIELADRHVQALDEVLASAPKDSESLARLADGCREHAR